MSRGHDSSRRRSYSRRRHDVDERALAAREVKDPTDSVGTRRCPVDGVELVTADEAPETDDYVIRRADTVYCSQRCRQAAYRDRNDLPPGWAGTTTHEPGWRGRSRHRTDDLP